ncbi:MAG: hypothetical protein AAB368_06610, partial [bacterium]
MVGGVAEIDGHPASSSIAAAEFAIVVGAQTKPTVAVTVRVTDAPPFGMPAARADQAYRVPDGTDVTEYSTQVAGR